jgi:HAD superfamily hydrolase (TIGR01509 family)
MVDCEVELVRQFGCAFPLPRFQARWPELCRQQAEDAGIAMKTGLEEFLSLLDERHVPIAVATSSDRGYTEFSLGRAGLLNRFAVIVTGDQVTEGKPEPDIYLEAARRLGVEPTHCVALEDSDAGIIAAHRAGMVPVMVPDLKPPSAEAAAVAFRVLRSLHEAGDLIKSAKL